MTQLLISYQEPSDWKDQDGYFIDPLNYANLLTEKWSNINISKTDDGYSCLNWEIKKVNEAGLRGGIQSNRKVIYFSANPLNDAIEYAIWHRTKIPVSYRLFLFDEGINVVVELKIDTTYKELQDALT
jgi:hypothetical protein